MSVKFLSAILGPAMGASILWAPGKCVLSKPMSIKFLVLGGGGYFGFGGGGSANFIILGVRIFLILSATNCHSFQERPD